MLVLAIDTATPGGGLAILEDSRILGVVSTRVEETYSSRLFRHLEFLLSETHLELRAMDLFAVAAGPGSFTGLRVGLAAVKGWAEVLRKPIASVSGLEAVAAQARGGPGPFVPVLDARRGQVYAGLYQRGAQGLERRGDERVMSADEFLETLASPSGGFAPTFVTPSPELLAEPLARSAFRGCAIERVSTALAPVIGQLGMERARRGDVVDSLHLDANYIRRSDAELLWKGR
jgi:tRNA threonylcarbamoyladenosine biosynthesis protein TsaB